MGAFLRRFAGSGPRSERQATKCAMEINIKNYIASRLINDCGPVRTKSRRSRLRQRFTPVKGAAYRFPRAGLRPEAGQRTTIKRRARGLSPRSPCPTGATRLAAGCTADGGNQGGLAGYGIGGWAEEAASGVGEEVARRTLGWFCGKGEQGKTAHAKRRRPDGATACVPARGFFF